MLSATAEQAIIDAQQNRNALLKFISPNNVGLTGGKERGYYLPKSVYPTYAPFPPDKGVNYTEPVSITWQNGSNTDSRIKWYGKGTRDEYRLTRFGRGFPFLTHDCVGNLLVLISTEAGKMLGYVFDLEDDILGVQEALEVEFHGPWAKYAPDEPPVLQRPEDCIDRQLREFAAQADKFPTGDQMSAAVYHAIESCHPRHAQRPPDTRLMDYVDREFELFKQIERRLRYNETHRLFRDIDDFLKSAKSIIQARKTRAGRSLENHVARVFQQEGVKFEAQSKIKGKPDFVIPSKAAYDRGDADVMIIGVKTTCKDRWRQVLEEGSRQHKKYLLTLQPGISAKQLQHMHDAGITLIVPKSLHSQYPPSPVELLTLSEFIKRAKRLTQGQQCLTF